MADGESGRPAALAAIGGTPIVRLTRIPGPDAAEVWVKLEGANPTGSYKDRMALAMIEGAERDGRLRAGQTVVEYTGGSTGSSLAFVCAVKGYPTRIVSSDAFAEEKLATMRAFGATLEVVPSPEGITPQLIGLMRERAFAIADEIGGFRTDQFQNHDMKPPPGLLWDTPGHVDPSAQLRVLRSRPAARERSGTHLHLRVHVLRRLRR